MKTNRFIMSSFFLLTGLIGCSESPIPGSQFSGAGIVNGSPVHSKDELGTSVVAIVAQQNEGVALCTGSILDKETILTAAHCVDGEPQRLSIVFSPKVQNASRDLIRVADRYVQNPRWQKSNKQGRGDLALVHFTGGLPTGYQPVQLVSKGTPLTEGTEVVMVGYGVSNSLADKGAGILRATTTDIEGLASKTEIITDGRKSSVCFGDSGGPAFVETANGFEQWGVASSVLTKACNEASVHTSVMEYEGWIETEKGRMAGGEAGL